MSRSKPPPFSWGSLGLEYETNCLGLEADGLFEQLEDDGFATQSEKSWVIPWRGLYGLLERADYAQARSLLRIPAFVGASPQLGSVGSLTDQAFAIRIVAWVGSNGEVLNDTSQTGACLRCGDEVGLLTAPVWNLVDQVNAFAARGPEERNSQFHRLAWGRIRQAAVDAGAGLDAFLHSTVVLTPEQLAIHLNRTDVAGTRVVQVTPDFGDCPAGWLSQFDRASRVLDRYDVATPQGICQVIVTPEVRTVLEQVKRMPGRRVAGARAEAFLANPIAALGEAAAKVIDIEQFEVAKAAAGLTWDHFNAYVAAPEGVHASEIGLHISTVAGTQLRVPFASRDEAAQFAAEARKKLSQNLQILPWGEFELEMLGDSTAQIAVIETALADRQGPQSVLLPDVVFDLSRYSERIEGFGEERAYLSPHIGLKKDDEGWVPENIVTMIGVPTSGDGPPILIPVDAGQRAKLREDVDKAQADEQKTLSIPGIPDRVSVEELANVLATLEEAEQAAQQGIPPGKVGEKGPTARKVRKALLIKPNIASVEYVEKRNEVLSAVDEAEMPKGLRSEIRLKRHQVEGLAWLQHLYRQAPDHCRGAVLADDMGLGKTLQLLSFIAWVRQRGSDVPPALVVAPVALLENWRAEAGKFFKDGTLRISEVYGDSLAAHRIPAAEIDAQLRSDGLVRFLRQGWTRSADIILTTYETMRDYEFSFAEQKWSVIVCDEAQKIKNANALVTRAAKKQNARFRVACTGTPVENSLADLWCLFDFIQPGYLGALNEFGIRYRRPIEAKTDEERSRVEELRKLIAPQILRRLKKDVASDLPEKLVDDGCKRLAISVPQRALYIGAVSKYQGKGEAGAANPFPTILGLLQYLRTVCTHPQPYGMTGYTDEPLREYRARAPKLAWLLKVLEGVKAQGEKALVFCEVRDVQRLLRKYISEELGSVPDIINGDTTADSKSSASRQKRIAAFQNAPGFGVIILSPLAVGFGVNIQAANHVIHYTRMWNPAKEDQATDRAYRIGQTKDVHVYAPVVWADDFKTFDARLDELLNIKRALAEDMLNGSGDVGPGDLMDVQAPIQRGSTSAEESVLTIHDVDSMAPRFFEAFVAVLWAKRGFTQTVLTPQQGDGGVDVVAMGTAGGELVQCKHSSRLGSDVGWDGIKDVAAGAAGYRSRYPGQAFKLVCATNQYFNANAQNQAECNLVRLVNREVLTDLLIRHPVKIVDVEKMLYPTWGE